MPQRRATILGDFDAQEIGHGRDYFIERGVFLDCRGTVKISALSRWGYCVVVLTGSHDPVTFDTVYKPVAVEACAWICSGVLLFNCHVGEGAIVAAGSVVRSRDVPPWTMVEGNPAQVVAKFNHVERRWVSLDKPEAIGRKHGGLPR